MDQAKLRHPYAEFEDIPEAISREYVPLRAHTQVEFLSLHVHGLIGFVDVGNSTEGVDAV